jgi:hypothetical protein
MATTLPDRQSRAARTLARIAQGTLPASVHGKVWVGPGSGKACSGCGESINATENEFERDNSDTSILCFHGECYDAWFTTS